MKRLLLCLAFLACPGCMMPDEFMYDEPVWYDAVPVGGCETPQPSFAPNPGRVTPRPQVVPLGPGIVPAGGTLPPPPAAPQTREPELLRK